MKSKRSNQEWELLVKQYENSKVSIVKFSNMKGLKPSTLAYWVKKHKSTESQSGTKLVKIKKQIFSDNTMVLSYAGIVIEIPKNISTEVITALINTIRETC
ncbi:MAG: hypothetical protein PF518_03105 [Spirochaetaceae bacterium]|jgi:transposase-like protein|nr:hypothetical protein [Spirochaetaceae bacterium]